MTKKNLRQKTALKTTLRLTLIAAVTASAGLVALLIIIFNLSKEEEGRAQSSMTFKQATTFQDTTRILRGSINQKIIGVVVETNGRGTPVKIGSITFTASGTSKPIERNIENARLWYTGNDPEFSLQQTVGNTVADVSDNPIVFPASQELLPGKNYFWLTFDIKADALTGPGMIDATCNEIRIGAISYLPLIADPVGKRFTQANVPYYSMGNYALNKVNSWNSHRDGSGTPPREMSETRNSYFIQSGHRMISSTGSNLQTLVVEKGGELRITSPLRLNAIHVACGGIVEQDTSIYDYYCFNEFYMDNGSMYIHNNNGLFPGLNCRFERKSNQVFFKYSTATFSQDISFGNLTMDARQAETANLGGKIKSVQGDFEVRQTGPSGHGIIFGGNDSLEIGGSFIMTGGKFCGVDQGSFSMHISGNTIIKGGEFYDVVTKSTNAELKMQVEGDVILLGGAFSTDGSRGTQILLHDKGTTRWIQKQGCSVQLGNVSIASNHTLILKGELFGPVSKGCTLDVDEGGEMMCGAVIVSGEGTFSLNENALLGIGHPQGIYSKGDLGNIQTRFRTYNSGATYYYYTASDPQITGVFETQPDKNSVRKLLLHKENSTQSLQLSQNIKVLDKCQVNRGVIVQGKNTLEIPDISLNK